MRHQCLRLLAFAASAAFPSALQVPAARGRPRTRLNHGRVATADATASRPLLNAVRRPWKIPGHVAGRLTPALADWPSSHRLAAPPQPIRAGVSAAPTAAARIPVVGGLVNVLLTSASSRRAFTQVRRDDLRRGPFRLDLASDVVTLVAMRARRDCRRTRTTRAATARFETVGALVVGGMLVAAGAGRRRTRSTPACTRTALGLKPQDPGGRAGVHRRQGGPVPRDGARRQAPAVARARGERVAPPVRRAVVRRGAVGIAAARCSLKIFRHADAAAGLAARPCSRPRASDHGGRAAGAVGRRVDQDALERLRFAVLAVPGVAQVADKRPEHRGKLRVDVDVVPLDSDLSTLASFQRAEAARVALLDMEAEDHGAHSHGTRTRMGTRTATATRARRASGTRRCASCRRRRPAPSSPRCRRRPTSSAASPTRWRTSRPSRRCGRTCATRTGWPASSTSHSEPTLEMGEGVGTCGRRAPADRA